MKKRNVTEVKIYNAADKLKDTSAPPKETETQNSKVSDTEPPERRYPVRERKAPKRFELELKRTFVLTLCVNGLNVVRLQVVAIFAFLRCVIGR